MKKNFFIFCLLIILSFISSVRAGLIIDYSGSSAGKLENLGPGSWNTNAVAIKISIVDSGGDEEDVEIFSNNSNGLTGKCSVDNSPKTHQSTTIKWKDCSIYDSLVHYSEDFTYKSWISDDKNKTIINLHKILSDESYKKLKSLLNYKKNGKSVFTTLSPGDYIIIEPMTHIAGYTGTAFELANAFLKNNECCKDCGGKFCYEYSGAVFGGSGSKNNGGIFFQTIYLTTKITIENQTLLDVYTDNGYYNQHNNNRNVRNDCFKSNTCGRGIGVFKYDDLFTGSLKITKKESGTKNPLSGAGFTLYSDASCSKKIVDEKETGTNGEVIFEKLNTNNYYYKETTVPAGYTGDSNCKLASVTNGNQTLKTEYNSKKNQDGTVEIQKLNSVNKTKITGKDTKLILYSGTDCPGAGVIENGIEIVMRGTKTIDNLTPGTYSIWEAEAPDGYMLPSDQCVVKRIYISTGKNDPIVIENDTNCQSKLNSIKSSLLTINKIQDLIDLYTEYPDNNGLLNFNNPTCSVVSCDSNNVAIDGCLSAHSGTSNWDTITSEANLNLSCKDDTITVGGKIVGFCQNYSKLVNNLNASKFYGIAGRFLIRHEYDVFTIFQEDDLGNLVQNTINNNYFATSKLMQTCFIIGTSQNDSLTVQPNDSTLEIYDVKFGDNDNNKIADQLQSPIKISSSLNVKQIDLKGEHKNYYLFKRTDKSEYGYKLNSFYLNKMTGKYSETKNNSTTEKLTGVLANFNWAESKTKGSILFKVNNVSSDACEYEVKPEIIKYDDDPNGKLDLEFRIIDTNEPFPNRDTKSNWCDPNGVNNEPICSYDNNMVTSIIMDSTNSYGLKNGVKQEPIYAITLTSSDIQIIRQYNDENSYDNYSLIEIMDSGNPKIVNSFLHDLKNGVLNQYDENNRIIKTYGTLSNRLE